MNSFGKERTPFFFMIDFDLENVLVYKLNEIYDILFDINGIKNHDLNYRKEEIPVKIGRIPFMEYKNQFDKVRAASLYGYTFLLNLSRSTQIYIDHELIDIFLSSKAKYKLLYKDQFVVFSPEPFVRIKDNIISSYPMKGTAKATHPKAAEFLMNNEKELSEHYTIVDLIRNDLSIVSSNVRLNKFRFLEKIQAQNSALYQLSSEIEGDLDPEWHERIGTILKKLLPAGSISGAPKPKTIELIKEIEDYDRGFYTGIMGIYNGFELDSGVMIRFIEKINGKYYYKSGGGITFQSSLLNEYSELLDKIYVPVF